MSVVNSKRADLKTYTCFQCGFHANYIERPKSCRGCGGFMHLATEPYIEEEDKEEEAQREAAQALPEDLIRRMFAILPEACIASFNFKMDKDVQGKIQVNVALSVADVHEEEHGSSTFASGTLEGLISRVERFYLTGSHDGSVAASSN